MGLYNSSAFKLLQQKRTYYPLHCRPDISDVLQEWGRSIGSDNYVPLSYNGSVQLDSPAPIRTALKEGRNPSVATCKAVSPRGLACCLWQLEIPPHCCKAPVQAAPLKSIWKNYLLNVPAVCSYTAELLAPERQRTEQDRVPTETVNLQHA